MAHRLGIDIGGTFTDGVLIDDTGSAVHVSKAPSTPQDPSIAFTQIVDRIIAEAGISPTDVTCIVHGTTVATNAIIEGKTSRTAFVTTDGFRDMLEIARQIRRELYNLQFEKPAPLVPRHLCFGVRERLDGRGRVIVSLNEDDVRSAAAEMRCEGVESVAVCFLHSYVNDEHERRARSVEGGVAGRAGFSVIGCCPGIRRIRQGQHNRNQRCNPTCCRSLPPQY